MLNLNTAYTDTVIAELESLEADTIQFDKRRMMEVIIKAGIQGKSRDLSAYLIGYTASDFHWSDIERKIVYSAVEYGIAESFQRSGYAYLKAAINQHCG